jgi:hypothetical protein
MIQFQLFRVSIELMIILRSSLLAQILLKFLEWKKQLPV